MPGYESDRRLCSGEIKTVEVGSGSVPANRLGDPAAVDRPFIGIPNNSAIGWNSHQPAGRSRTKLRFGL